MARIGAGLRLGGRQLNIVDLNVDQVTMAALLQRPAIVECVFRFLSPTFVSRSGRDYLLPDPELLVRQLVKRWNALADEPAHEVPELSAKALGSRIVLKRHELCTKRLSYGNSRSTGFVGTANLGIVRERKSEDAADGVRAARLLATLEAFVEFSGVGAANAYGLGAVSTGSGIG